MYLDNRVRRATGGRGLEYLETQKFRLFKIINSPFTRLLSIMPTIVVILLAALQGLSERRLRGLFLYFFTTHQSGVNGLRKNNFLEEEKIYGKRIRDRDRADFISPGQRSYSLEEDMELQD